MRRSRAYPDLAGRSEGSPKMRRSRFYFDLTAKGEGQIEREILLHNFLHINM